MALGDGLLSILNEWLMNLYHIQRICEIPTCKHVKTLYRNILLLNRVQNWQIKGNFSHFTMFSKSTAASASKYVCIWDSSQQCPLEHSVFDLSNGMFWVCIKLTCWQLSVALFRNWLSNRQLSRVIKSASVILLAKSCGPIDCYSGRLKQFQMMWPPLKTEQLLSNPIKSTRTRTVVI